MGTEIERKFLVGARHNADAAQTVIMTVTQWQSESGHSEMCSVVPQHLHNGSQMYFQV